MMKLLRAILWLSLAVLVFRPAPARPGEVGSDQSGIRAHTEQGIRYVTGGVGGDQRAAIASMAKDFNLKLVFAEAQSQNARHAFVTDVAIRVIDGAGREVLNVAEAGPWMMASLPKGSYRVIATRRDASFEKAVEIGGDRIAQLAFYW